MGNGRQAWNNFESGIDDGFNDSWSNTNGNTENEQQHQLDYSWCWCHCRVPAGINYLDKLPEDPLMKTLFMQGLEMGLLWGLVSGFIAWGIASGVRMLKIIP